jgi:hypothetical protein
MKNITKNVLATLVGATAAISIANAQDGSAGGPMSATVNASTTMGAPMPPMRDGMRDQRPPMRDMREGGMMGKTQDTARDLKKELMAGKAGMHASNTEQRKEIKGDRKELMGEREDMHASNTQERMEMNADIRMQMKNATSAEERKMIMDNAREERDQMRASNTEERKELNERSRAIVQNRVALIAQRLDAAQNHLQNALTRLTTYVSTKASGTPSSLTKATASGAASASAIASLQAYASTTITVDNKDSIKSATKTAQDAIKTFQDDLKAALEVIKVDKSMWDLKANKKM